METKKPHAVCVPLPTQGHVTPLLMLAKLLHLKGFHITFVHTEYNHRRLVRSRGPEAVEGLPDFRFATIPDGLPPSDADATQDPASICYSTMTTCLPHLKKLLRELNGTGAAGVPPVTCVVADNVTSFSVDAAAELGVPCALFWTASAAGYMGYCNFRFLMDKGIAPLKDEAQRRNGYLETPVPDAPGMSQRMRLRDFPSFICTTDRGDVMQNFLLHEVERTGRAAAVIVNTLDELERPALDAMRAVLPPTCRVYTIGPLHLLQQEQLLPGIRASLWREDRSCLEWLDGREPGSVVYVNFGSITTMSGEELVEFAWGLANSGHPFLWIVRKDLLAAKKDDDAAVRLPPEFVEATKGRCLLASWCEQEAVLQHPALGVFLTHCGWNSTFVAISAGLPMLCWPFFAEQQTNSRYACLDDEWGVGLEVGDEVRREVVESRIRAAMGGDDDGGNRLRRKAAEWKEMSARAAAGRSMANLDSLINDVLMQPPPKPAIPDSSSSCLEYEWNTSGLSL
ncbi:Cytokinin-O-glucosyltransferase 2 [Hordeum vulgare]|nr:Cytokinin-O-glucosyltransferase 2 [Hordeum vulgare]